MLSFYSRSSKLILEQAIVVDPYDAEVENKTKQFKKLEVNETGAPFQL